MILVYDVLFDTLHSLMNTYTLMFTNSKSCETSALLKDFAVLFIRKQLPKLLKSQ